MGDAILVAAGPTTVAELEALFGDEVELIAARTYDETVQRCEAQSPALVLIGYHFDEAGPYRLIHGIRSSARARDTPIVVVRLRAGQMGSTTEQQAREAYRALGVQHFFSVPEQLDPQGRRAALAQMREQVLRLLAPADTRSAPR